jgi:elongation factor P hydroxylase
VGQYLPNPRRAQFQRDFAGIQMKPQDIAIGLSVAIGAVGFSAHGERLFIANESGGSVLPTNQGGNVASYTNSAKLCL